MKKLILFSGGIDSSTILLRELCLSAEVSCVSFDYGQTHDIELRTASETCVKLNVRHKVVKIDKINKNNDTYKCRNLILITKALDFALGDGCETVLIGANRDDSNSFADCTKEFLDSLKTCCRAYGVELEYPLLSYTKSEVVALFNELNKLYQINTWTCYTPINEKECGKCSSCKLKGLKND